MCAASRPRVSDRTADGELRGDRVAVSHGCTVDTSTLIDTLSEIRVPGSTGRPTSRPDRVRADKGYPSKAHRAWPREHGIATTVPERDDQIAHRRKHPGRPIDFGREQKERYKRRNAVERCFNELKQWRGIAMRSDKTARNDHSAICLAAILQWTTESERHSSVSMTSHSPKCVNPAARASATEAALSS